MQSNSALAGGSLDPATISALCNALLTTVRNMQSQSADSAAQSGHPLSQANPLRTGTSLPPVDNANLANTQAIGNANNAIVSQVATFVTAAQNLLDAAATMTAQIGHCHLDDDARLAQALYESEVNGSTYHRALEGLNNINGHSAMQWRDYYLDHGCRIHQLMRMFAQSQETDASKRPQSNPFAASTAGKPSAQPPASTPNDRRVERNLFIPNPPIPKVPSMDVRSKPSSKCFSASASRVYDPGRGHIEHLPQASSSRRANRSLLYSPSSSDAETSKAYAGTKNGRDKPGSMSRSQKNTDNHTVLPRPLRAPTPPMRIEQSRNGLGIKFTEEDQEFFVKSVLWEVGNDPSLTKTEVTRRLAEKTPHHNASGWARYWTRNSDLADKVYRAAKAHRVKRRRPTGWAVGHDGGSENDDESVSGRQSDSELSEWESDPNTDLDIVNMGGSTDPWGAADTRVLARWIAMQPDWKQLSRAELFGSFVGKYKKRTVGACAFKYYSDRRELDRMAQKYLRYKRGRRSSQNVKREEAVVISLLSDDEEDVVGNGLRDAAQKRKSLGDGLGIWGHGTKRRRL